MSHFFFLVIGSATCIDVKKKKKKKGKKVPAIILHSAVLHLVKLASV